MRHCSTEGSTNQWGFLETLREALLALRPAGNIAEEKVELNGLLYVIERLPVGIEECRFINLPLLMKGILNLIFKQLFLKRKGTVTVLMKNK
jgi:hypothetical protein